MGQHTTFRAIFTEFRRALAAARRYENLRYGRACRDHFAPGEIPRLIFEEFYAGVPDTEDDAPFFPLRRLQRLRTPARPGLALFLDPQNLFSHDAWRREIQGEKIMPVDSCLKSNRRLRCLGNNSSRPNRRGQRR